jgi:hypothetical protein
LRSNISFISIYDSLQSFSAGFCITLSFPVTNFITTVLKGNSKKHGYILPKSAISSPNKTVYWWEFNNQLLLLMYQLKGYIEYSRPSESIISQLIQSVRHISCRIMECWRKSNVAMYPSLKKGCTIKESEGYFSLFRLLMNFNINLLKIIDAMDK